MIKKTFLPLLLVFLLLCCSCTDNLGTLPELPESTATPPLQPQEGEPIGQFMATLYYVSNETGLLTPLNLTLSALDGEPPVDSVIDRMLISTDPDVRSCIPTTLTYQDTMVSNGIANVFLIGILQTKSSIRLTLAAGIAATLSDTFSLEAVNIFVNEEPLYIGGMPLGAMFPIEENLVSYVQKTSALYDKDAADSLTLDTFATFYLPTDNKDFLLMHFKEYQYIRSGDKAENIMSLLSALFTNFDSSYPEISALTGEPLLYTNENAMNILELSFLTSKGAFDETIFSYSIALTLMGYLNYIDGVVVRFSNGTVVRSVNLGQPMTQELCFEKLADVISLCYPSTSAASMTETEAYVKWNRTQDVSYIVEEMLKKAFYPDAMYPEFSGKELNFAYVRGATAILDFDGAFYRALSDYIGDGNNELQMRNRERLIIYSFVNTLTNIDYVNSVWFLEDGKRPDTLKYISFENPLMRSDGLTSSAE